MEVPCKQEEILLQGNNNVDVRNIKLSNYYCASLSSLVVGINCIQDVLKSTHLLLISSLRKIIYLVVSQ